MILKKGYSSKCIARQPDGIQGDLGARRKVNVIINSFVQHLQSV